MTLSGGKDVFVELKPTAKKLNQRRGKKCGVLGRKNVKRIFVWVVKGLELLEVVNKESFQLASRGLKEVSVVCATEADWVVVVCFLLKMILAAPLLRRSCMSQNCHRQVARKESYDMVIGVFSSCNVSICCHLD